MRPGLVAVLSSLMVGLSTLLGTTAGRAAEIDRLFAQFNRDIDGGNYSAAEATARRMLTQSFTDGWKAASYNCLGRALKGLDRHSDAIEAYRTAMRYRLSSDNVNLGWIPNNLGLVYLDQEKYQEAERYLDQARTAFERIKGSESSESDTVRMNLGIVYRETNRYDEAERMLSRSLATRKRLYGSEHLSVASVLFEQGQLEHARDRGEQAESCFKQALAIREKLLHPDHFDLHCPLHCLAEVYRDQGRFSEAEPLDRRSLQLAEKKYGMNHTHTAFDLENVAADLEGLNRSAEAESLRKRAELNRAGGSSAEAGVALSIPVVVHAETAEVRAGPKTIATVRRGRQFEVFTLNGSWCGIEIEVDNQLETGWLRDTDIISTSGHAVAPAPEVKPPAASKWTRLSPADARATIDFPGSPKATTQTVNDVVNYAYTLEIPGASYVFSYFDVPAGKVLTFDAAINAYTTRREGSLKSQRTIFIDEYPGKEYLVSLAGDTASRLRLFSVSRRWYQIAVEGDADVVQGEEAGTFFDSFQLAE